MNAFFCSNYFLTKTTEQVLKEQRIITFIIDIWAGQSTGFQREKQVPEWNQHFAGLETRTTCARDWDNHDQEKESNNPKKKKASIFIR